MDQEYIINSWYQCLNHTNRFQKYMDVVVDLQWYSGPGNACSWLVYVAYDPRKRLEWSGSFEISWNNEFNFALFWYFFKFGSGSYASFSNLFWSAHHPYVLRNELGLKEWSQSSSINAFDFDLIPFKTIPKIVQIQSFCAPHTFTRIWSDASWTLRPKTCKKSWVFNILDFLWFVLI